MDYSHLVASRTPCEQSQESASSVASVFLLAGWPRLDIGDWLSTAPGRCGPHPQGSRILARRVLMGILGAQYLSLLLLWLK